LSDLLQARRAEASRRLGLLAESLVEAANLAKGKACVYLTGSFGRGEASSHSDLDLFIVGRSSPPVTSERSHVSTKPVSRRI
jgi:predicted nucleotidyltransferase